jgi:thiol-disulfide isomerase/thioredoxin
MPRKMKGGCLNLDLTTLFVVLVAIAILVVAYYFIYRNNYSTMGPTPTNFATSGPTKNIEGFTTYDLEAKEEEVVIALFSADWCPHCTSYKPKWKEIEAKNNGRDARPKLRFVSVDCTDGTPSEASKFNIEGYPTVLAIANKNGKQVHEPVKSRDSLEEIFESVKNM